MGKRWESSAARLDSTRLRVLFLIFYRCCYEEDEVEEALYHTCKVQYTTLFIVIVYGWWVTFKRRRKDLTLSLTLYSNKVWKKKRKIEKTEDWCINSGTVVVYLHRLFFLLFLHLLLLASNVTHTTSSESLSHLSFYLKTWWWWSKAPAEKQQQQHHRHSSSPVFDNSPIIISIWWWWWWWWWW